MDAGYVLSKLNRTHYAHWLGFVSKATFLSSAVTYSADPTPGTGHSRLIEYMNAPSACVSPYQSKRMEREIVTLYRVSVSRR